MFWYLLAKADVSFWESQGLVQSKGCFFPRSDQKTTWQTALRPLVSSFCRLNGGRSVPLLQGCRRAMSTLRLFRLCYQRAEPGSQLEESRVSGVLQYPSHHGFGFSASYSPCQDNEEP